MHAPTILAIFRACTGKNKENSEGVIGLCFAMLLKLHYSRMSLVQKVISVLLLSGHTSKQVCYKKMVPSSIATFLQVYERLQKLCISMSHRSVVRLHRDMGKDYDKMVHDWRKTFLPSLISNFKVNDAN